MFWLQGAPLVGGIAFLLITGGVLLLWPASRRLGRLMEVMIQDRRHPADPATSARVQEALAALEQRLVYLEERQSFTDQLLAARSGNDVITGSR
jgi:hypothetical protein